MMDKKSGNNVINNFSDT